MKRQLTRKLSTAEFAHSHSGPRPTSDPAPISDPKPSKPANNWQLCTSLRPGPFTYTHAYHLSVLGVCRAPPPASLQSPPGAALPLARSAARHGQRREGDGAWRERRRRAAAGRRAKTSKMATPCGHQPTYRGAVGLPVIDVWGSVVHHYRHCTGVSSHESSRPPRSPSGCGGSSSAWRV